LDKTFSITSSISGYAMHRNVSTSYPSIISSNHDQKAVKHMIITLAYRSLLYLLQLTNIDKSC